MKLSVFQSDSLKKLCFFVLVLVMAFIAVPIGLFSVAPAQAEVIINEWSQGTSGGMGSKEWVELLVTADTDMRGWLLRDTQGSGAGGIYVNFKPAPDTFWQAVPAGTLIVIYNANEKESFFPADDLTLTDGNFTIIVQHNNPTLFDKTGLPNTNQWLLFGNGTLTDNPILKNNVGAVIHDWDQGDDALNFAKNPPRPAGNQAVYYTANSITGVMTAGNYTRIPADIVTPGNPNGGANTRLINFLRSPVVSKIPASDATDIEKTSGITVRFSDSIDGSTVTDGTFQINGSVSGIHTATFSGGGTDTITADPADIFVSGETVSVTLTTDIKSTGGVALAADHAWSFTVQVPPAAPSGLSAEPVSHDAMALNWTDNSDNEDGFIVDRADMMSGWTTAGAVGADVTSFTDSGLSYSSEYSYRVRAWNAEGSSVYSSTASAFTWFHPYETCGGITLNGSEALYGATLQENAPAGTVIGKLNTVEPTGAHRYELFIPTPQGIDNRFFVIDGDILKTSGYANPDHEEKKELRVCLISVDIAKPYAWCHAEFVITVTDVPEAPTFLHLSGYKGVPENQPGSFVANIVTEDDPGDSHTYRIVSGEGDTDNALFYIEGNTLKTNPGIDYETRQNLSIRVQSEDHSGAAFERFITLTVKNAPDPPLLSDIGNVNTDDEVPLSVNFTVSDQDTVYDYLTVSAKSDNPEILPDANIALSRTGADCTAMLTPIVGKAGMAKITLTVKDGDFVAEKSFTLTVTAGPGLRAVTRLEILTDTTVYPGDMLRYFASITNDGDRDSTDVALTLPLPDNTEYADSGKRSDFGVNLLEWTGDIPAGETVEIAFDLRVKADVSSGDEISWGQGTLSYDSDGDGVNDTDIKTGEAESSAGITVEACRPGDANSDGDIGLADVVAILQLLCGSDADVCADADSNNDGRIGIEEAVFIVKRLSE